MWGDSNRKMQESHKNPSVISGCAYTPFDQWKFREFNEIPHLFERRLKNSYPFANVWMGQFPHEKLVVARKSVQVPGVYSWILLLATVIETELFLHLEITPHRTVLFYLSVFGSILAVARGMIPEENGVSDSEILVEALVQWTAGESKACEHRREPQRYAPRAARWDESAGDEEEADADGWEWVDEPAPPSPEHARAPVRRPATPLATELVSQVAEPAPAYTRGPLEFDPALLAPLYP